MPEIHADLADASVTCMNLNIFFHKLIYANNENLVLHLMAFLARLKRDPELEQYFLGKIKAPKFQSKSVYHEEPSFLSKISNIIRLKLSIEEVGWKMVDAENMKKAKARFKSITERLATACKLAAGMIQRIIKLKQVFDEFDSDLVANFDAITDNEATKKRAVYIIQSTEERYRNGL